MTPGSMIWSIAPVVLPLVAGALDAAVRRAAAAVKAAIKVVSTFALAAMAVAAADRRARRPGGSRSICSAGWPAPFGIVLVLDRLSALMLVLTGVLASASLVFSLARWHRRALHFHALFQFLLMGLNGAFLTGDLFNLFVFFEVLLAASYGLALHGSGSARVTAGLHYIAVNLAASLLFLIGVSLIYARDRNAEHGGSGGLAFPLSPGGNRMLLEAGAAILGIVFLVKAGMWPLGFWLPSAYAAASRTGRGHLRHHEQGRRLRRAAPLAAVVRRGRRRLGLFRRRLAAVRRHGDDRLRPDRQLAAQDVARLAGFAVLVFVGHPARRDRVRRDAVTGGALFYLVSSTLAHSARSFS